MKILNQNLKADNNMYNKEIRHLLQKKLIVLIINKLFKHQNKYQKENNLDIFYFNNNKTFKFNFNIERDL